MEQNNNGWCSYTGCRYASLHGEVLCQMHLEGPLMPCMVDDCGRDALYKTEYCDGHTKKGSVHKFSIEPHPKEVILFEAECRELWRDYVINGGMLEDAEEVVKEYRKMFGS
ncbi:MAG: hypothetical protein ACQ9ET_00160 [Nitrosomonadaceae bacterium]